MSVQGLATVTAGQAVAGRALVIGDEVFGTAEVDGSVGVALRPLAGDVLAASYTPAHGFLVAIDGQELPLEELVGPISVERSLDQYEQRWSFGMDLDASNARFGTIWQTVVPLGKKRVDIWGVYQTPTGVHRLPLIVSGLCHHASVRIDPSSRVITYNGVDKAGRRDRKTVTLVLPAGHGLRTGAVVRRLLSAAGETAFALSSGGRMRRELQAVDANPVALSQRLLEDREGRTLLWNRRGEASNPRQGARERPLAAYIGPDDVLYLSSVDVQASGDVVTAVTLTGEEQITREDAEACGREITPQSVEISAVYAQRLAAYTQSGTCSLTPRGVSSVATLQIVQRVESQVETLCGTVVAEGQIVSGWQWLEAARYQWAGGVRACRSGAFLPAGSTEEGSDPAYVEPGERWRVISEERTRHYYARQGYRAETWEVTDPWGDHLAAPNLDHGYRRGSVTERFSWYQLRAALKQAVPAQSWEETDVRDVLALGSGEGVAEAQQFYRLTGRLVEIQEADDDGFLRSATVYEYGWTVAPGSEYWYATGEESGSASQIFGLTRRVVTSYVSLDEGSHARITLEFDGRGSLLRQAREIGEGQPPAVARVADDKPSASTFDTSEEAAGAKTARPNETKLIKVRVVAPLLEEHFEPNEVKTQVEYAESEEELERLARLVIRRSAALAVSWSTFARFSLGEGDWIQFTLPEIDLDHEAEVYAVSHVASSGEEPVLSTFTCLVYPIGTS